MSREFWIIKDGVNDNFRGVRDKKPSGISGGGSNISIHVIEKKAYNKAVAQLNTAIGFLKEGKRKFAPHTTNSDVDCFLKELGEL